MIPIPVGGGGAAGPGPAGLEGLMGGGGGIPNQAINMLTELFAEFMHQAHHPENEDDVDDEPDPAFFMAENPFQGDGPNADDID